MTTNPTPEADVIAQPSRRSRKQTIVIAGMVVAALAVTATVGVMLGRQSVDGQPTASAPTTAPAAAAPVATTPAVLLMSEREACMALVPVLADAADVITIAVQTPKASAVNAEKAKLDATTEALEGYVERIPEHMEADVRVILRTLVQVENMRTSRSYNIQSSRVGAAGIAIATLCQKYAS